MTQESFRILVIAIAAEAADRNGREKRAAPRGYPVSNDGVEFWGIRCKQVA